MKSVLQITLVNQFTAERPKVSWLPLLPLAEKQWSFSEKGRLGYGRTLIAYAGSGPPRHSTSTYDGPGGVFTIAILKNHDQPFYNVRETEGIV